MNALKIMEEKLRATPFWDCVPDMAPHNGGAVQDVLVVSGQVLSSAQTYSATAAVLNILLKKRTVLRGTRLVSAVNGLRQGLADKGLLPLVPLHLLGALDSLAQSK